MENELLRNVKLIKMQNGNITNKYELAKHQ